MKVSYSYELIWPSTCNIPDPGLKIIYNETLHNFLNINNSTTSQMAVSTSMAIKINKY